MQGLPSPPASSPVQKTGRARAAVRSARRALLDRQKPDGHWVGELQGDTILESEYILLMAFLGRERDDRVRKAANYILEQQTPDGGWSNYPGGPADLSVSVKAYFALKLAGHDRRRAAHAAGRARSSARSAAPARCNSFTKFYLALLGQFPYANCPAVPPEMMLLPRWFYFNIYAMSSWTRTIVVPLSIFSRLQAGAAAAGRDGHRASCSCEPPETPLWPRPPSRELAQLDQLLPRRRLASARRSSAGGLGPFRRRALRKAAAWMREHFADSDGLGAIFPPMIYTVIACAASACRTTTPEMRWALKQLDDLMIEEGDTLRLQPCFSPVWDTALTLNGLADAGHVGASTPRCDSGVDWLLDQEVRRPGDWSLANPRLEPGGWFFEYRNGFYPDTDDTAMVLMALARTGQAATADGRPAVGAARLRWLLGMQNRDGGWAAFDRDINREVLTKVPFADHNAMLDPSCPDITARVLEALGHYGYGAGHPQVAAGARVPPPDAGAARRLAGPLGRQLHLRHLAGAAGLGKHRLRHATTRWCAGPSPG